MAELRALIAAHPIRNTPYNSIKFSRIGSCGTLLYRVASDTCEVGAAQALKRAFERFGGHCFHCDSWMPPQPLSTSCTRDHVRPRKDGGNSLLYNLVFSCGRCNQRKGGEDLISFSTESGSKYLRALEAHIQRCLAALADEEQRRAS